KPNKPGAKESWEREFAAKADALKRQMQPDGRKIETPPPMSTKDPDWFTRDPVGCVAWFLLTDSGIKGKLNPIVLPVGNSTADNNKEIQIDYVRGAGLAYEIVDIDRKQIRVFVPKGATDGQTAHVIRAQRMVVVSAAFPYREQLKLIAEALR